MCRRQCNSGKTACIVWRNASNISTFVYFQIKGETEKGWGEYSAPFYATTRTPYGRYIDPLFSKVIKTLHAISLLLKRIRTETILCLDYYFTFVPMKKFVLWSLSVFFVLLFDFVYLFCQYVVFQWIRQQLSLLKEVLAK